MRYVSKNRHGSWRFRVVVPAHLRAAFPELPGDTSISIRAVDPRHYAGVARKMTAAWWMIRSALEAAVPLPELSHYTLTHVVHQDGRRECTLTTSPGDTPEQLRAALNFVERTGTPMPAPVLRLAERLSGIVARTLDANIATMSPVADMVPAMVAANDVGANSPWLSDTIERWRLEQQALSVWKVSGTWTNTYEPALRDFRELVAREQRVVGTSAETIWDLPMAHLNRAAIDTYIEGVRRLPKQQGKRPDGRDAKMRLKLRLPPQPLATANKKIRMVGSFLRWAVNQELLPESALRPVAGALRGSAGDPQVGYLAFSCDEVAKVLIAASGGGVTKGWQFWSPRIAAFTGARVREIADLTVEDIIEEAGVACFWFRGGEVTSGHGHSLVKRVKTGASERVVPIACALVDAGFLEYVKQRRELERTWLWDGLAWTDKDGHGRGITRWFAKLLRTTGVKVDRRKTFHSFRSTLLQAFDRIHMDAALAARVVGHKEQTTAGRHYQRSPSGRPAMPVARVKEKLDQIEWGLRLEPDPRFGAAPSSPAMMTMTAQQAADD